MVQSLRRTVRLQADCGPAESGGHRQCSTNPAGLSRGEWGRQSGRQEPGRLGQYNQSQSGVHEAPQTNQRAWQAPDKRAGLQAAEQWERQKRAVAPERVTRNSGIEGENAHDEAQILILN